VFDTKIEQYPLRFRRRGEELKEEVSILEDQLAELAQRNLRSSALIRKLGEFFGFGAAGKLEWRRFKLNFKQEELNRFEAEPEMLKVADEHCDTVPELPSKYSTTRNLLKGKKWQRPISLTSSSLAIAYPDYRAEKAKTKKVKTNSLLRLVSQAVLADSGSRPSIEYGKNTPSRHTHHNCQL
jgi:hypothetical protein